MQICLHIRSHTILRNLSFSTLLLSTSLLACGGKDASQGTEKASLAPADDTTDEISVEPVSHASFVMTYGDHVIYNDPVGGAESYERFEPATLVLVSDIHGDHLDSATLEAVMNDKAELVMPAAAAEMLSPAFRERATVLANGEAASVAGLEIEALPMYNLREDALDYHPKGRGNGYVFELGGERIYIAGDTEDIPEMRALTDIDRAFIPMNLPYTMPVDAAADAVTEFAPRIVYPYHYRGGDGFSDTAEFRQLVHDGGKAIEVVGLAWYP